MGRSVLLQRPGTIRPAAFPRSTLRFIMGFTVRFQTGLYSGSYRNLAPADPIAFPRGQFATLTDMAGNDAPADVRLQKAHRAKLHLTDPIQRLARPAICKDRWHLPKSDPTSVLQPEQLDEGSVQPARYMTRETIAPLANDVVAACLPWPPGHAGSHRTSR